MIRAKHLIAVGLLGTLMLLVPQTSSAQVFPELSRLYGQNLEDAYLGKTIDGIYKVRASAQELTNLRKAFTPTEPPITAKAISPKKAAGI